MERAGEDLIEIWHIAEMVRAGRITLRGENLRGAVHCEDLGSESCISLRGMLCL